MGENDIWSMDQRLILYAHKPSLHSRTHAKSLLNTQGTWELCLPGAGNTGEGEAYSPLIELFPPIHLPVTTWPLQGVSGVGLETRSLIPVEDLQHGNIDPWGEFPSQQYSILDPSLD